LGIWGRKNWKREKVRRKIWWQKIMMIDEGEAAMPRKLLELKHEYSLTLDSCLVLTKLQPIKIELLVI
jgi:hypothetical protein